MIKKLCTSILSLLILVSCSPSLVYSPSFNLEHARLAKNDLDISGSMELLPETRPEQSIESFALGYQAQIRYAFGDDFVMGLKTWGDLEGKFLDFRSGYALTTQFTKALSERERLLFIPRAGISLSGSEIAGYGLNANLLYQYMFTTKLSVYGGAGLLWGFYDLEQYTTNLGELRYPMGYAINTNLGMAYRINPQLRLNAEINPIFQINNFDQNQSFVLAPSLSLGYRF